MNQTLEEQKLLHIVIVTGQAQANLIPILQFKPDKVVLLISSKMGDQANNFKKNLVKFGNYTEEDVIEFDLPDADLELIGLKGLEIFEELKNRFPAYRMKYNVTGGNKLMVLGLYEAFRGEISEVFYTDMAHDRIEVVLPRESPSIPIKHVLSIKGYLLSMGQQYRRSSDQSWEERARHRKNVTKHLGKHAEKLEKFFSAINSMAHDAVTHPKRGGVQQIDNPDQEFSFGPFKDWKEALDLCKQAELCEWDPSVPEKVCFNSLDAALFLSGGWLEEYVWHLLSDLQPVEVLANVEFTALKSPKDDVRNEIDSMAVHKNRLLIVECKSGNLKKRKEKTTDILYKMNTLKERSAGFFGESCLVSAQKPDDSALKRAKEYQIEVFYGAQLKKDLKDYFGRWVGG